MEIFGNLPGWVIVLLCLLLAGVLTIQNLGWLLAAKARLDQQQHTPPSQDVRPTRPRLPVGNGRSRRKAN